MDLAFLVDVDGTLANLEHRLHFLDRKPKDWENFYKKMDKDSPIHSVIKLVKEYANNGYTIIILTGRPERYRAITKQWLDKNGVPYDSLIMKPPVDEFLSSHVWKKQQALHLLENYQIDLAIDDELRNRMVFEELGIKTLIP